MKDQLEMVNAFLANSIATTTSYKNPIFITIIVFLVRLFSQLVRRYHQRHVFTFHPNHSSIETPYCAVCLHEAAKGERLRKLPKCKHCFHVECIETWFESHPTCPLCRSQVFVPQNRHQRCWFSYCFLSLLKNISRKLCDDTIFETPLSSTDNSRGTFSFL